jgi:hypothetical protein
MAEGSTPRHGGHRHAREEHRPHRITVRLSAAELEALRRAQQGTACATISDFLRTAALGRTLPARKQIPHANLAAYRALGDLALDLRQLGINVNAIAVRLHTERGEEPRLYVALAARLPELAAAVDETRAVLTELRQALIGAEG